MKRDDLIRKLEEMGCVFVRHGSRRDRSANPSADPAPSWKSANTWHDTFYEYSEPDANEFGPGIPWSGMALCSE